MPTIARGLLAECLRALRPDGVIYLHGLAGDRATTSVHQLPGPAAAVRHVPAAGEVVDDLVAAGFADVQIETLSETAYFVVDDVSMREIRVVARKPGHRPAAATHQAIYLGPMREVVGRLRQRLPSRRGRRRSTCTTGRRWRRARWQAVSGY